MRARLLLAATVALACPGLAAAADPWRFPSAAARAEAKCGQYFNENYDAAKSLLEKDPVANADAAIAKLRCAIDKNPRSGPTQAPGGIRVDYHPYLYLALALSNKSDPMSAVAAQQCLKAEAADKLPKKEADTYARLQKGIDDRAASYEFLAVAQRVGDWEAGRGTVTLSPGAAQRASSIKALAEEVGKAPTGAPRPTDRLSSELRALAADEMKTRGDEMRALEAEPWKKWTAGVPADQLAACRAGAGGTANAALDAVEKCFQGLVAALRAAGRGECEDLAGARRGYAEDQKDLRTWEEWESAGRGRTEEPASLPRTCDTKWSSEAYATLAPAIEKLKAESAAARGAFQEQQRTVAAALQKKRDDLRACLATQLASVPEIPAECNAALGLGPVSERLSRIRQRFSPQQVPAKGLPNKELVPCGPAGGDLVEEIKKAAERGADVLAANKMCPTLPDEVVTGLDRSLAAYRTGPAGDLRPLCQAAVVAKKEVDLCWQRNIPFLKTSLEDFGTLLAVARRETAPQFSGSGAPEEAPGCLAKAMESVNGLKRGPDSRIDVWAGQAREAKQRAQGCLDDLARLAAGRFAEVGATYRAAGETFNVLLGDVNKEAGARGGALPPLLRQAADGFQAVSKKAAGIAAVEPLYQKCEQLATLRETLGRAGLAWGPDEKAWSVPSDSSTEFQPDERAACAVVRDAAVSRWIDGIGQELAELRRKAAPLEPYLIVNGLFSRIAVGDVDGAVQKVREVRGRRALPEVGREAALTETTIAYVFFLKKRQLEAQKADPPVLEAVEAEAREAAGRAGRAVAAFRPPERLFPGEAFRTWYDTVRP